MSGNPKAATQPDLTQRQRQILKLLQAGKVNKEVARELDIGVGTVKQHIVALFKKLNVTNRAMAVSRGMDILHEQENQGAKLNVDGLLERRPCVVLSVALPEDASPLAVRLMHGGLVALASSNDAVFLARKGNAGDVIFGIQRVTEYDLAIALQTVQTVYSDLLAADAEMAGKMRGCLNAGLAIASMKRFGGWTGEAIASAVIASARELLNDTPPGCLSFDSATRDLIDVFGIGRAQEVAPVMAFSELDNLHWTGARRAHPMFGRADELATLEAAMSEAAKGNGGLIHVEGEMGMGKTRLCDEVLQYCQNLGGQAKYFRCLPAVLGSGLYDSETRANCVVEDVAAHLTAKPVCSPELLILDDFHLLTREQQDLLSVAGAAAVGNGKLVIFSGRRGVIGSGSHPAESINLRRLSAEAIDALVRESLGKDAAKAGASEVQDISSAAAGVPLFAVELARHHDVERLALPLLVVVTARLDSLSLDRNLLRAVARNPAAATIEDIAETLGETAESLHPQLDHAMAVGVLSRSAAGYLSFTHPLLRRAIDCLVME